MRADQKQDGIWVVRAGCEVCSSRKKKSDLADVCKVEQIHWRDKARQNLCTDVPLTSVASRSKTGIQGYGSGPVSCCQGHGNVMICSFILGEGTN